MKSAIRDALRNARHALVTHNGAHATDRPDLVGERAFGDISWQIEETKVIRATEALRVLK
jgi:hypothetical protein